MSLFETIMSIYGVFWWWLRVSKALASRLVSSCLMPSSQSTMMLYQFVSHIVFGELIHKNILEIMSEAPSYKWPKYSALR